jgi:hypothetical protein
MAQEVAKELSGHGAVAQMEGWTHDPVTQMLKVPGFQSMHWPSQAISSCFL